MTTKKIAKKTLFSIEAKYMASEHFFSTHGDEKYCHKVFNIKLICLATGSY